MAVAAYASVLSLLHVVDNIQHPYRLRLFPDTTRIDALSEKLCFLQDILEVHSSTMSEDTKCMVRKILVVTNKAESLIDNYRVDQLKRESGDLRNDVAGENIESFHNEIRVVIKEIESINEALSRPRTTQHDKEKPKALDKFTGNKPLKSKMVGFDDQLKKVLEKLTGNQQNLMIVPIVGMGGIGKTTLARSLFHHPYNLEHFHVRIWLTLSQDYSIRRVLQELLNDGVVVDKKDRELGDESEAELITQLYQKLFGQRYLIVLDDVWSVEAWDDLRRGFPNNGKGSRVVLTTRLSDIANSIDSQNNSYLMEFLDDDKSWDLFSEVAFEQGGWSRELEETGREISKRCKGLPLVLVTIGRLLLASSDMKVEYWKAVAEDINSFASCAYDENCSRILSLSYHHLPIHLKPCFLYMRHFEEDSEVVVSELIETWVAQGFVKPMRGKTLEEAAGKYLEDLIGRNLLLGCKIDYMGNIKSCIIHDLLRDLCIKESNREQLFKVPRILSVTNDFDEVCLLCDAQSTDTTTLHTKTIGSESKHYGKISVCSSCESTAFPEFARSRFAPLMTKHRGISIDVDSLDVLDTVHQLWNLEILHIKNGSDLDLSSIPWKMPQLRHVKILKFMLADPAVVSASNHVVVLENLQTLYTVRQFKCTEEIVRRIPHLRKLGLYYDRDKEEDWSCFDLQNLAHYKSSNLCP